TRPLPSRRPQISNPPGRAFLAMDGTDFTDENPVLFIRAIRAIRGQAFANSGQALSRHPISHQRFESGSLPLRIADPKISSKTL
ncbi:MAG: hypothetical protein ACYDC1_23250, partial [Limisphaerales bacterium]